MLTAAASVGVRIIGRADAWEVSGAANPMTRPKLGPWLRGARGPYDGLVAAAVDRLGRNVVDCLISTAVNTDTRVSYGHFTPTRSCCRGTRRDPSDGLWGVGGELPAVRNEVGEQLRGTAPWHERVL